MALKSIIVVVIILAAVTALVSLNPKLHDKVFGPSSPDGLSGINTDADKFKAGGLPNGENQNPNGQGSASGAGQNGQNGQATGVPNQDIQKQNVDIEGENGVQKKKHPAGWLPDKSDGDYGGPVRKTKIRKPIAAEEKDVNQDDLDWINQEPDPNVSVALTVTSVERYRKALEQLKSGDKQRSLEIVFHMGQRAGEDIVHSVGHMERAQYTLLEPKMAGFVLDRKGVFQVYPDYEYFQTLAEGKGTEAESEYFRLAHELNVNGVSNYYTPITEFSTCTKYGQGLVVGAYQKWSDYQKRHPHFFVNEVADKVDESKGELTKNDCLCGNERSLYKEYEAFAKAFPKADLNQDLQARMAEIKKGTIKVHADCQSSLPE